MKPKNPYLYRWLLILAINALAISWLIHEMYFPAGPSDVFGLFLLLFIVGLLIYNLYAVLVAKFFFRKGQNRLYIEGLCSLLLVLPIFVLWYFTH